MVPSTLGQVLIFIVLLMPGVAHVAVRERRWSDRTRSGSREILRLVYVSPVADGLVLAGFSLIRWQGPPPSA